MFATLYRVSLPLIIFLSFISGAAFFANAQIPTCHLYDSTKPVSQGFGASYDLLSAGKKLLIKVSCFISVNGTHTSVEVGNMNQLQYIYKYGYEFKNNQWNQITFSGQHQIGDWVIGEAATSLQRTPQELQNINYVVAYVCTKVGNEWKCGCADSACTQNFWQLQAFKYP